MVRTESIGTDIAELVARESGVDIGLVRAASIGGKPAMVGVLKSRGLGQSQAYARSDQALAKMRACRAAQELADPICIGPQEGSWWIEAESALYMERACDWAACTDSAELSWRRYADNHADLVESANDRWIHDAATGRLIPKHLRAEELAAMALLDSGLVPSREVMGIYRSSGSNGLKIAVRTLIRILYARAERAAAAERQAKQDRAELVASCGVLNAEDRNELRKLDSRIAAERQAKDSARARIDLIRACMDTNTEGKLLRIHTSAADGTPNALILALSECCSDKRLSKEQRKAINEVREAVDLARWQESLQARKEALKRAERAESQGKPDSARRYRELALKLKQQATALEPESAYPGYASPQGGRMRVPSRSITRLTRAEQEARKAERTAADKRQAAEDRAMAERIFASIGLAIGDLQYGPYRPEREEAFGVNIIIGQREPLPLPEPRKPAQEARKPEPRCKLDKPEGWINREERLQARYLARESHPVWQRHLARTRAA